MTRRRIASSVFLAAAFLFALLALLPLRLALDAFGFGGRGLSARAATGSVWLGALNEARVGPVPLGDLSARLNLLPLFLGRARLSLSDAQAGGFRGAVTVTRHSFGLDDVSASLRVGALLAPIEVSTLDFDEVSAAFAGGRCVRAGGRVGASAAGGPGALRLAGLSGETRCDGDALLLPLASDSGRERLDIRLFGNGRYRAEIAVRTADVALRGPLVAAGFRPVAGGYWMRVDGAF